ncbi:MAG: hypothetical protein H5U20_07705 [Rhodobacteraceae bacterium]|nr:hypothetical protein [Paracoccaceae bacterium]
MSTWTSSAGILALALSVSGCVPGVTPAPAVRRLDVAGGAVTLAAPPGFCVDRTALRDRPTGAFVLFGSCAALAPGPFSGRPSQPAVLAATVAPPRRPGEAPIAGNEAAFAALVQTPAGRAALSRSGDAGSLAVHAVRTVPGAVLLDLEDRGAFDGPRVAPRYWRALIDAGDRLVTLSVLAPRAQPLAPEAGLGLLDAFIDRVHAANPR